MEPGNQSAERLPQPGANPGEQFGAPLERPQSLPQPEHQEQRWNPEQLARTAQQETAPQQPAVAPAPILPAPQTDDTAQVAPSQDDSTPLLAGDDDVIEKEWVDKVKQVLAETKDDPYKREQEVKRLQIEYVRKRYGKEIGTNREL